MIDKSELGRRLREARTARGFTLKEMDHLSGFSATHISEIERGKTSPTIGALVRIAQALGRAPSYFIEVESLPDTAHVPAEATPRRNGNGVTVEVLSPGVPGGRLSARRLTLDPGGEGAVFEAGLGSIGGYLESGRLRIDSGGTHHDLESGAALHLQLEEPVRLLALGDEPARILVIATGAPSI